MAGFVNKFPSSAADAELSCTSRKNHPSSVAQASSLGLLAINFPHEEWANVLTGLSYDFR